MKQKSDPIVAMLVLGLMLLPIVAAAQNVAWRTQVMVDVPAAGRLKMMSPGPGGASSTTSVSLITFATPSGSYRYRAIAVDPVDGALRWSRDLAEECAGYDTSYGVLAVLANGDVVVSVHGNDETSPLFACLARLRASDGTLMWVRTERSPGVHIGIYALASDADGQLLATGRKGENARTLRIAADSGTTLWDDEIAASEGNALRGVAIASGAGDSTVVHLLSTSLFPDASTLRLIGLSTSNGQERWRTEHCPGARVAYAGSSDDQRLRVLPDATVAFVSSCGTTSARSIHAGRINVQTGTVIWQRDLPESNLYRGVIDERGNPLLEGALTINGAASGMVRLAVDTGATQWSLPPSPALATSRIVVAGDYVHVLELAEGIPGYALSATLAKYSAGSGQFAGRFSIPLPADDLMVLDQLHFGAFGDGDVFVGGVSGHDRSVGGRLFLARLQPTANQVKWTRQQPVSAPHRFEPIASDMSDHQMSFSGAGATGVVVGGHGTDDKGNTYPRVGKISNHDGRIVWRWQTSEHVDGAVRAVASDAQGNVIIAGSKGRGTSPLLLAKLDGASGNPIWEFGGSSQSGALDMVRDGAGNPVLVLDESGAGTTTRVAKHSVADGSLIWEAALPDGRQSGSGDHRVAVAVDGNVLALGAFSNSSSGERGIQLAKIRGGDGVVHWLSRLPGTSDDRLSTLRLLQGGDVFVHNRNTAWRVNGATGAVVWQKTLPLYANASVLDAQGDIVLGGRADNHRVLAKLNAATGTAVWTRQLESASTWASTERVSTLTLAADGNILAAGGDGYLSHSVMAIAAQDGALIWQTVAVVAGTSNGAEQESGRLDYPVGILQAPDGNVFFGGFSAPETRTWTVYKITGQFADGIFASGFD